MGNKRKASIIIVSVLIAAFSVFFATYDIISRINSSSGPSVDAAYQYYEMADSSGLYINSYGTMNVHFSTDDVWLVVFRGQDGQTEKWDRRTMDGSVKYYPDVASGEGALCYGFYRSSPGDLATVFIDSVSLGGSGSIITSGYQYTRKGKQNLPWAGWNGMKVNGFAGGGKTTVDVNFGLPVGSGAGKGIAGGGGGAGQTGTVSTPLWGSSVNYHISDLKKYNLAVPKLQDATFAGYSWSEMQAFLPDYVGMQVQYGSPFGEYCASFNVDERQFLGMPATQESYGLTNAHGYVHAGNSSWQWDNTDNINMVEYMNRIKNIYALSYNMPELSAGGGGYYAGSAATFTPASQIGTDFAYGTGTWIRHLVVGGGGGSCSPNIYPVFTSDSYLCSDGERETSRKSRSNGYVYFLKISPTDSYCPKGQTVAWGEQAGVSVQTNGSSWTSPYCSDPGYALFQGSCQPNWSYANSRRSSLVESLGTSWVYSVDGGNTWTLEAPTRSALGTTEVKCRYVLYAEDGKTDEIGPTYKMKYTDPLSAASDESYVIKEVTIYLTVNAAESATVTAPTKATGLIYNGALQSLVTGQGSAENGTLVYQVQPDGGAYDDNAWTTDVNNIKARDAGYYRVWYKALGDKSNGYADSSVSSFDVYIKPSPPGGRDGLLYTGAYQRLLVSGASGGSSEIRYKAIKNGSDPGGIESWADVMNGESDFALIQELKVGDYTVYYAAYAPSGSLADVASINVSIGKATSHVALTTNGTPTGASLIYDANGSEQFLFATPGAVAVDENNDPTGVLEYRKGTNGNWKPDYHDDSIKESQVGTYTIQYRVRALDENNYITSDPVSITVKIGATAAELGSAPVTSSDLKYNGKGQALIKQAAGAPVGGTVKYRGTGDWVTDINDDSLKGTNAANYVIQYKVEGDSNHSDSGTFTVIIPISKATATVKTAPNANFADQLVFDGEEKNLLRDGGAVDTFPGTEIAMGAMRYSVVYNNVVSSEEYYTDWRDIKATKGGEYVISYWAVANGNANLEDSQQKGTLTVTIAQQKVTGTAPEGANVKYDGTWQYLIATAGEADEHGIFVYSRSDQGPWTENYHNIAATGDNTNMRGQDAGTYTIYYKIAVKPEYESDYAEGPVGSIFAIIGTDAPTYVSLPVGYDSLPFNNKDQQLLSDGGSANNGTIWYRIGTSGDFVYTNDVNYLSSGKYWTDIKAKDIGTYIIQFYIKGNENYSDSTIGQVVVGIGKNRAEVKTDPTARTGLKYTGSNQQLLADDGAGVAVNGTMVYRLGTTGDWVTDHTTIVGKAVGTYTIYFKAAVPEDDDNYVDSVERSLNVEIGLGDSGIGSGTLAVKSGLAYTGSEIQLFEGTPSITGDGTAYYALVTADDGTDPVAPAVGFEGTTDLAAIKGLNAFDGANRIRYYLYFRLSGTASYRAYGWTLAGVNTTIAKAEYDVSVHKSSDVYYDGVSHAIFTGDPIITSTADTGMIVVSYRLVYSGFNYAEAVYPLDENNNPTTTTNASDLNQYVINAGNYYLQAMWSVNPEYASYANQIMTQDAWYNLATFVVNKAQSGNGVTVVGLNYDSLATITNNGTVAPFGDATQAVDLTVGINNEATYNGITTHNYGSPAYNKLGFVFTKSTATPDLSAFADSSYDTAAGLNNAIRELTANESGVWYLWFNVTQHSNLADGVRFKAATITVNGFDSAQVPLGGVVMQGAQAAGENGVVTYNAQAYNVVAYTDRVLTVKNYNGLSLGSVEYAVSTSPSLAPSDGWVVDLANLETKTDVGTYYLWVRWSAGSNVTASTGRVYANFQIVKLNAALGNFYFSGVNFNTEQFTSPTPTIANYVQTYALTFNNKDQSVVSAEPTIAAYEADDPERNLAGQFGTFNLGISTSKTEMKGSGYLSLAEYENLTVRNAGSYYLWISWTGSENFEAGTLLYRVKDGDNNILTPCFQVNQLTSNATVELKNTSFISDAGNTQQHEYQFITTNNSFQGVEQALFTASALPGIMINTKNYDTTTVKYQYTLSRYDDSTTESINNMIANASWVNSVEAAKQTAVGTYYLWIKIKIEGDSNANITKYVQLASSEIVATSSFALIAPTAKTGLEYAANTAQVLITASTQQAPLVAYSLGGSDDVAEWTWTTNAAQITGTEAGVYKVYYRGAAYPDMFNDETEPETGYPFIYVTISKINASITSMPRALDDAPTYNGQPISNSALFTAGESAVSGTVLPLWYSWDRNAAQWYHYDDLPQQTNAGSYVLYCYPDNSQNPNVNVSTDVAYITVNVNKAAVEIGNITTGNRELIYKAKDYQVFLPSGDDAPVDYGMYDTANHSYLTVDGEYLTYSNYDAVNKPYGTMGKIYYAVSTAYDVDPASGDWIENYTKVTVRQVGTYYLWVKVDAGDNHLGHEPKCFKNSPITITAADNASVNLDGTTYTVQLGNDNQTLRYNGLIRTLISDLDRVIQVLDRDDDGNPVTDEHGDYVYNQMHAADRVGTVYYALTNIADEVPGDLDSGWQSDWRTLAKTDAGSYYLYIRFVSDNTSNIGSFKVLLTDGTRPEITIAKASKTDLSLSGISGISKMYTGDELSIGAGTATSLTITIKSSRFDVTDQIDLTGELTGVQYFFWKRPVSGAEPTGYTWTDWANAKATDVGQYQLYVYIRALTSGNNIDVSSEPLIYKMFVNASTGVEENFAEITPADEHYLSVVAPRLSSGLIYNGLARRLIQSEASLEMQKGNDLKGNKGTAWYFVSSSSTELVNVSEGQNVDGWYNWLSVDTELKQKYAGTYYIWVKFDAGDSHTAVAARYVGSVTIAQATGAGITLSNLDLLKNNQYDGKDHVLIDTSDNKKVLQTFNGTDTNLVEGTDYTAIYYGYSDDANVEPTIWIAEADRATLTAREAGDYYIWVKVIGTGNVADYTCCYDVNDYASIAPLTLIPNYYKAGINIHTGLSYIGENQILANTILNSEDKLPIVYGGLDLNTAAYNDSIVVEWGLGTSDDARYGVPAHWTTDLATLQGCNAGHYYLWVKITGSNNINAYSECYADIEIAKAELVLVEPGHYDDVNNRLIYTGEEQTLLTSEPVVKIQPTGIYYAANAEYDVAGVVIQYAIGSRNLSIDDFRNVKGLTAKTYEVCYGVFESDNWKEAIQSVNVTIYARDASAPIYGLAQTPYALPNIEYNETEQDIIAFGRLVESLAGVEHSGTAWEGSTIEFWYGDANTTGAPRYIYYFDTAKGEYAWVNNVKLPGRTNAGSYAISYIVTHSTETSNYADSAVHTLNAQIGKRRIWWNMNPDAIRGLRYNGTQQTAIRAGQLNVPSTATGVTVKYTMAQPGSAENRWNDYGVNIPKVNNIGVWDIYYYVDVNSDGLNNNVFVGQEDNTPERGTLIKVMVENFALTIRSAPYGGYLRYTGVAQDLVTNAALSTDDTDTFAEKDLPYFEYSFDGNLWEKGNIQETNRGVYTIYYRLHYDSRIFEFSGNIPAEGQLTATIQAMYFDRNSIRAVYNSNDNTLSVDASAYTTELQNEILAMENGQYKYVNFKYRTFDDYNQDTNWNPWINGETPLNLGSYQFRVIINGTGDDSNFYTYTQDGDFDTYEVAQDRYLYIELPKNTYSTVAYVRAWIDFTGTMLYEDAPEQFKHEGWLNPSSSLFYIFPNVNSTGRKGSAVIRVQTVNSAYYFRTVNNQYTDAEYRKQNGVDWSKDEERLNRGLNDVDTIVYLYEVYHIQYDANGAALMENGVAPTDGWKWHGINYLLEENIYKKYSDDNEELVSNGWNTTRAGNGNNYANGSYYRENVSQIFYANFFVDNKNALVKIEWIITNGITTYRLATNTGGWYNVAGNEERDHGIFVTKGEQITLPQIIKDEDGNEFWQGNLFGNYYISGWYMANDDWTLADGTVGTSWYQGEYSLNMNATRDLMFVAKLASQTKGSVECVFMDDQDNQINYSGLIANGANAYMALSGMDATTIKNYSNGYKEWVEKYGDTTLTAPSVGKIEYALGAKTVVETINDEEGATNTWNEYITMFIILGVGVITTITSLSVYLVMRKKNRPVDLKKFKEEVKGRSRV